MKASDREAHYWKAEYECLRRRTLKENRQLKVKFHNHVIKTWKLLKALGMKEKEIIDYYARTD